MSMGGKPFGGASLGTPAGVGLGRVPFAWLVHSSPPAAYTSRTLPPLSNNPAAPPHPCKRPAALVLPSYGLRSALVLPEDCLWRHAALMPCCHVAMLPCQSTHTDRRIVPLEVHWADLVLGGTASLAARAESSLTSVASRRAVVGFACVLSTYSLGL